MITTYPSPSAPDRMRAQRIRAQRMRPSGALVLVLVLAQALLLASGSIAVAAPGTAGPAMPDLVAVQVPASARPDTPARGPFPVGAHLVNGCRLVLRPANGGPLQVLSQGFTAAADPEVSFDGTTVLFAGKRAPGDSWQIWRLELGGRQLEQVTSGPGDHASPLWVGALFHLNDTEPTRQIVYTATDHGWWDDRLDAPAWALYASDLDGGRPCRISFNPYSDGEPDVLANGRLVFSSWYAGAIDRPEQQASSSDSPTDVPGEPDAGLGGAARYVQLAINIDGTDMLAYAGNQGPTSRRMPAVEGARAVWWIYSDPQDWLGGGALALTLQRRPLHSEQVVADTTRGWYHSPRPLPDGDLLASFRPRAQGGAAGPGAASQVYAVQLVDPATGAPGRLLIKTEGYHTIDAHPVTTRPRVQGRSSVVDTSKERGILYCISSHISQIPGLAEATPEGLAGLRVIEAVPAHGPGIATSTRILAEVPLAKDGSFNLDVPAGQALRLQLLDRSGMAVAGQRTWTWVMPREWRGCIGCHEDREMTPPNRLFDAATRPATALEEPQPPAALLDYVHTVAPLLARRCATGGCHGPTGPGPFLGSGGPSSNRELSGNRGLSGDPAAAYGRLVDQTAEQLPLVLPGSARSSRLLRPLRADGPTPHPVALTEILSADERRQLIQWIDLGAPLEAPGPVSSEQPDASGAGGGGS